MDFAVQLVATATTHTTDAMTTVFELLVAISLGSRQETQHFL
ncbi:MAG: hypothetical protein ACLBM4_22005 [Dolichospermum sp.]